MIPQPPYGSLEYTVALRRAELPERTELAISCPCAWLVHSPNLQVEESTAVTQRGLPLESGKGKDCLCTMISLSSKDGF